MRAHIKEPASGNSRANNSLGAQDLTNASKHRGILARHFFGSRITAGSHD